MKLTEKELKHLDNIRKYQRNLHKMRYFFLFTGVLLIAMALVPAIYFWVAGSMLQLNKFTSNPIFYFMPIFGGVAIGYAIQGMKGNSVHVLLLRVIDELREK